MSFLARVAVGFGVASLVGASACASNRDAMYTQMQTPDDARILDGDPHLVDDHGNVQVHSPHKLDALDDPADGASSRTSDLGTGADAAAEKLRGR